MNQDAGSGFLGLFCLRLVEAVFGGEVLGASPVLLPHSATFSTMVSMTGSATTAATAGAVEASTTRVGSRSVAFFHVLALVLAFGFGTGNGQFAAHERLVVKDFHGAHGFVHVEHFHKAVALRAVGAAVVNDLDVADAADALEELLEVLFGNVVGQVADINAGGFDAFRVATTRAVGVARRACLALALAFRRGSRGGRGSRGSRGGRASPSPERALRVLDLGARSPLGNGVDSSGLSLGPLGAGGGAGSL